MTPRACIVIWLCLSSSIAIGAEPNAESIQFFEKHIRPLFVEHCVQCHGPEKQRGGLRLDTATGLTQGGDSGIVIVAGDVEASRLITAVQRTDDELLMPPDEPLSPQQVELLETWVKRGAVYPVATTDAGTRRRDRNHWAFQPPQWPSTPQTHDTGWSRTPIDDFILDKMRNAGLRPADRADRATLIRRVTFDLTGLAPTSREIDAFVHDARPDAYTQLVERLLASPAYGERWGRHWLDVARYADSNGLDENIAHGNAWRYRDYVVESFNQDKPYREFVIEQLAGDQLTANEESQHHQQLIATGFLVLGPKVLAEPDKDKLRMDIVDEQIDTTGRAFLAMTFGCARCHNHKFDPIDAVDYYGLAGIFKSTRTMESLKTIARWHENPLASDATRAALAAYQQQIDAKKAMIAQQLETATAEVRGRLAAGTPTPANVETEFSDAAKTALRALREELAQLEKSPPDLPAAMGVIDETIADEPLHPRGDPIKRGDIVPRHTPDVMRGPSTPEFTTTQSGRLALAEWMVDPQHPLTSRVLVNRVWRWHFGQGLVRSTDNFGLLGELPTHPELLDWLALRFQADGWSIKSLHRLLVLSATYQQSSQPTADTVERDPDNRWFSRAPIDRLDAESLRDVLLQVSGQLDRRLGGSLLQVKNREFLFDHTSKDMTDYTSRRRSLYLPVIRNNLFDMFQLLDFPDAAVSSSDRATTTVATQALMMLNSPFVMDCADQLATQCLAIPTEDAGRLDTLYQWVYGRRPTAHECDAQMAFLQRAEAMWRAESPTADTCRQRAWSVLCHALLSANEFCYVR